MRHIVDTQNLFTYIHYRGCTNAVNERMNYHHQVVHDCVSQKCLLEDHLSSWSTAGSFK